jgi:hypothetical protein
VRVTKEVGKARYLEVPTKFREQRIWEPPIDKGNLNAKLCSDWTIHQTLLLAISLELCRARENLMPLPLLECS